MKQKLTHTWWFNIGWCLMELGLAWMAIDGNEGAMRAMNFWSWVAVIGGAGALLMTATAAQEDTRSEWVMHLMSISDVVLVAVMIWNDAEGIGWRFAIGALLSAAVRQRSIDWRKTHQPKDTE